MTLRLPPPSYRVVRDNYAGYEAQYRPWWCPFWLQCSHEHGGRSINTNVSLRQAKDLCVAHRRQRSVQVVARVSVRGLGVDR
jgi:hypothetical protein